MILVRTALVCSLVIQCTEGQTQGYPITWSQSAITDTQVVGTTKVIRTTFSSSSPLENVTVRVAPEIAAFVTVTPSLFTTIPSQQPLEVMILVEVPGTTNNLTSEGTVRLSTGKKTLARPLPVTIRTAQAGEVPPASQFLLPSEERIITDPTSAAEYIRDELLVGFSQGYGPSDISYLNEYSTVVAYDSFMDMYQLRCYPSLENQLLALLEADNRVRTVTHNIFASQFSPMYPLGSEFESWDENNPSGNNYHFEMCRFPSAWSYSQGSINLRVGVIDGGFCYLHTDLQGRVNGVRTISNDTPIWIPNGSDHGTRIAGIIGADGRNGTIGIAGAMWDAALYLYNPYEMLNSGARVTFYAMADMLRRALLNDQVRVVNISLGYNFGSQSSSLLREANQTILDVINAASSAGRDFLIVCAAGNDGVNAAQVSPACLSLRSNHVITVAATNESYQLLTSPPSNSGEVVTVAAPGSNIFSTTKPYDACNQGLNTYHGGQSGTSFAAPLVAGLAGLLWSYQPSLTGFGVKALIAAGAQNGNHRVGNNDFFVINAYESFRLLTPSTTFSWQQTSGPPGSNIQSLVFDPSGNLYAGCVGAGGVFRSTNSGNSWTAINNGLPGVGVISLATNSSGYIFAGAGGIYRSTNGGNSWTAVLSVPDVGPLAINASGHIFTSAFTSGGIYRSTNGGDSWTLLAPIMHSVVGLAASPWGHLFAGTQGSIYRSTDNGNNWTQINTGLVNPFFMRRFVFNSSGHVFVSAEFDQGVYRSTNNGESWTAVNVGIPQPRGVYSLAINTMGHLFAGTIPTPNSGAFRSTNNGDSWEQINTGLFDIDVLAGAIGVLSLATSSNGFLFAGTYGAGVFRSTQATTSLAAFNGEPKVTTQNVTHSGRFNLTESYNAGVFLGTNPEAPPRAIDSRISLAMPAPTEYKLEQNYPNPFNPFTRIEFALPEDGLVTLKVFDVLGRELATLLNERKSAGYHSVEFLPGSLASGVYFYRIQSASFLKTRSMILAR